MGFCSRKINAALKTFPSCGQSNILSMYAAEGKMPTIYFPLTANPAGHHHLLLAECVLRQFPETKLIVFLLSNGQHPDPLKQQKIPEANLRLEILRDSLAGWSDPEKSLPAQIAEESGTSLKLKSNNCAISRSELSFNRPLRLAEHVQNFSVREKVPMLVGADLIKRILNPKIFTDNDLIEIEKSCHLLIAPRNEVEIEPTLQLIKEERNVILTATTITPALLPQKLQIYLLISSTIIRRAKQSGHDLESFLSANAARKISKSYLYEWGKNPFKSQNSNLNELQYRCQELMELLEESAKKLKNFLDQLLLKKQPHRFAIVETCTGGQIAEAFTCRSGASQHFLHGSILYSQKTQNQFLGQKLSKNSSLSQTRAEDLAQTMLEQSGADWALAETGMAGPLSQKRQSKKNGQCHLGLALSSEVRYKYLEFNPFLTRKEHRLLFAIEALNWAEEVLQKHF